MRSSGRPPSHPLLGLLVLLLLALLSSCLHCTSATTILGAVVSNAAVVLPTIVNLYQLQTSNVSIDIVSESAAASVASLLSSAVDFSIVGSALTTVQAAAYPNLTLLPVIGGAVVAVYRLDALNDSAAPLTFSGRTLALIYAGNVTSWNDSLIQADNPGVALPNVNISVGYQADARGYTGLFLSYLVQSEPSIAAVLPPSNMPPWPTSSYASSHGGVGVTGVMAYVVNTDGAIGYGVQQAALPYDATIARLINRAGYVVDPTLRSIEYAIFESVTASNLTYLPDSTNPPSPYAWPVLTVEYLLLHNDYSPRGCEVRNAVLAFWLWFYEKRSSYSSIAANFVVLATPSLVQQQLAITATLTSAITCNGAPLNASQSSSTNTVQMYAPSRISQQLASLNDFYLGTSNITDATLNLQSTTSDQSLTNANNGAGLGFYIEAEITNSTVTPQDTTDNYILPSFLTSIVYTYNFQLSSTVTINSSIELVIDFDCILRIIGGNISDWHDPRLVALNPILATILDDNPAPTTFIIACVGSALLSPIYNAIGGIIGQASALDAELQLLFYGTLTNGVYNAFESCSYLPGVKWQFATQEQSIPALVSNVPGAIGYAMDVSSDKAGQLAMMYPLVVDAATGITVHTKRHSTPDALIACADSGFDAKTLTIDVATAASIDSDCWPMTQVVYGQIPHVYPIEQGMTALATMDFLEWVYTEDALDTYAYSNMFIRTSDVPAIQSALITALASVTTSDGNPLIRLPITWTPNTALLAVTFVLALLAGFLTLLAMAVTIRYHKDAVFRSSSPLFMLVSFFGLLHLSAALVMLTLPANELVCGSFTASLQVGFTLLFAPLFAKAYRIYRIFGRRKLKVVKLSSRRMLLCVALVVLCDAMYLCDMAYSGSTHRHRHRQARHGRHGRSVRRAGVRLCGVRVPRSVQHIYVLHQHAQAGVVNHRSSVGHQYTTGVQPVQREQADQPHHLQHAVRHRCHRAHLLPGRCRRRCGLAATPVLYWRDTVLHTGRPLPTQADRLLCRASLGTCRAEPGGCGQVGQ